MISVDEVQPTRVRQAGEIRSITRFAMTGGLAAACNVSSRILLSKAMRYELAVALAYLIGMVTAFLLARALVFQASYQTWRTELVKFASVNLVSFAQVWIVSVGLDRLVFPSMNFHWHADSVAHLIGVASPLPFSYYGHKHFTFRRTLSSN